MADSYYKLDQAGIEINTLLEYLMNINGYVAGDGAGTLTSKIPITIGTAAPTTATVGIVPQIYIDKTAIEMYVCTAVTPNYTWLKVTPTTSFSKITGTVSTNASLQTALNAKQDVISDLSTIRSGASAGATAVQPSTTNNLQNQITSLEARVRALEER